jgi:hypothetical protein
LTIKYVAERFIVVLSISISAFLYTPHVHADSVTSVAFDVGVRSDDVNWNIAGNINGTNPNVLSELTWTDLRILQTKISVESVSDKGSIFIASASYGSISSGSNQDSDYMGDNRTFEWSRSNNNSSGDNVFDFELGLGYQFDIYDSRFNNVAHIIPMLGYSYHEQNLRMTNGYQTISVPAFSPPGFFPPLLGPFDRVLNSTYQTEWDGLWAGVQLWFRSKTGRDKFYLSFKHHRPDYSAEANWNLATRFAHPKSFEHQASGKGNEFLIGWVENTTEVWALKATLQYQKWQTDPGIDIVYFSDGTVAATRLNDVEWKSTVFTIGIERRI